MALLLVALVICVELHELFPKGDPIRSGLVAWHFRLGLAVFVLVWLRLVLRWVDRLRPRRTILTHMGTDMDWAWLAANLPPGVEAGMDGMVVEVAG